MELNQEIRIEDTNELKLLSTSFISTKKSLTFFPALSGKNQSNNKN
jgi:hypothetical protein